VSRTPAAHARGRARGIGLLLVLAAAVPLATACSAGQVAATAMDVPAVEGAMANRGGLALLDLRIATPPAGSYRAGDDAALYGAIATDDATSDTLVSVHGDVAANVSLVHVVGGGSASPSASSSAAPAASASSSPSPSPSPSAAPPGSAGPVLENLNLALSGNQLVTFKQGGDFLQLDGLTHTLIAGTTVSLTFSFAQAGDITLAVPVATPDTPEPRPSPSHQLVE
jgi:copper(I)-binding protein